MSRPDDTHELEITLKSRIGNERHEATETIRFTTKDLLVTPNAQYTRSNIIVHRLLGQLTRNLQTPRPTPDDPGDVVDLQEG